MRFATLADRFSGGCFALLAILVAVAACGGGGKDSDPVPRPPGRAVPGGTANTISPTSDGGFVIAGTSSGSNLLVMKFTAAGNVEWSSAFGQGGNESGYSVQQTSDGGFIAAGVTDDPSLAGTTGGIYVVKTQANGRPSWEMSFGGIVQRFSNEVTVRQTTGGGYVVAGTGPGYEFNPEPDAYLVTIGPEPDPAVTVQTFNGAVPDAGNQWLEGHDVRQTADGGYILAGRREGGAYAVKVDAIGIQQWEQAFDPVLTGPIYSVVEVPGGDFVYIGRYEPAVAGACSALIVKGSSATTAWTKTVGPLTACNAPVKGKRTVDGGYIIATRGNSRNGDAYVIRTDASGNELWATLYGGDGGDFAADVIERPNGFLVVGGTTSFGGTPSIYLLDLDANGTPR